jgi:hypothetical protein
MRSANFKRILLALIAVAFFAAIILIFLRDKSSIGRTVAFSDGTKMTLKQVTYGMEHHYHSYGAWQRLLSVLPRELTEKITEKFAPRRAVITMGGPSVVFWFERSGAGPAHGDPQLVLRDAGGFSVSGVNSVLRTGPPGDYVEGWGYEFWPRRGRTFSLQIYEPGSRYPEASLIGEFTIRNRRSRSSNRRGGFFAFQG